MIRLILTFLKIGAAAFGGGWTVVGVIKADVVGAGWLSAEEFTELVALAQITPGPVALNAATLVGDRLYGFPGALAATLAVVAAPIAASVLAMRFMDKARGKGGQRVVEALKTATFGLLAMTLWTFAPSAVSSWLNGALACAAFALSIGTKLNPVWIILGAGLLAGLARGFGFPL